jgi:aconitase B
LIIPSFAEILELGIGTCLAGFGFLRFFRKKKKKKKRERKAKILQAPPATKTQKSENEGIING